MWYRVVNRNEMRTMEALGSLCGSNKVRDKGQRVCRMVSKRGAPRVNRALSGIQQYGPAPGVSPTLGWFTNSRRRALISSQARRRLFPIRLTVRQGRRADPTAVWRELTPRQMDDLSGRAVLQGGGAPRFGVWTGRGGRGGATPPFVSRFDEYGFSPERPPLS